MATMPATAKAPGLRCPKCGGDWFSRDEADDLTCIYCSQRLYQYRQTTWVTGNSSPCQIALTPDELSQLAMLARAAETDMATYIRSHLRRPIGLAAPLPAQPEVVIHVKLDPTDWRLLRHLGHRRDWPLPLVLRKIVLDILAAAAATTTAEEKEEETRP